MAKEKFEDRRLFGAINVVCKFENEPARTWSTRKEDVVANIISIVDNYTKQGFVLTLRQLHYQLVKANAIVNHDTAYKKLGDILDDCRYAGVIDWQAIEDRGRVPILGYAVDGIEDALRDTADQYKRDRQEGQDTVVEVWTEKDALSGILKRVTDKYHVRLVVNKGYSSSSAMYRAYQRILNAHYDGRKFQILYFGDHDPSGLDMIRDIRDRLSMMLEKGDHQLDPEDAFNIKQIGLTMQQIKQYKLPPNPTKMTDARADAYIEKFGKVCWEVDGLDPQQLIAIVDEHVESVIDMDKYEEMIETEAEERAKLRQFIRDNDVDEDDPDAE
jgi:hypothetical protein